MKKWHGMGKRFFRLGLLTVIAVLLVGMLSGCNIIALGQAMVQGQKAEEKTVLVSSDGKYQMTVPGDWADEGTALNDEAILGAGNRLKEKYVVVIAESKADFYEDVTIRDYMDVLLEQMEYSVEDMTFTPAETVSVSGRSGYLTQIEGAVDGIKITYWLTCVEMEEDFVQITGWTMQSKAGEYEEEFREVETSFQEAE